MEIESDDIGARQFAHFAGSESGHKRKFSKKVKSVRDVDQAFVAIQGSSSSSSVCFKCGLKDQYKRNCPNLVGLKTQKTSGGNGNKTEGSGGVKKYQPASSRKY